MPDAGILVVGRSISTSLHAKKKKKSKSKSGGGFGISNPTSAASSGSTNTISADKNALERQWDTFASITDLEIRPMLDPDDDKYRYFEVADVFVRCSAKDDDKDDDSDDDSTDGGSGREGTTGWYRTGKVVAADNVPMSASLTLQRGLIYWTAAHMWPQLVAAGGKSGAALLQLGYVMPGTMCMACDTDGPLDEDDADEVLISERVGVGGVSAKDVGFRPDFNPPGFTYKRREKAAMKKKRSKLEEIADAS